jgi:hypothetical protein
MGNKRSRAERSKAARIGILLEHVRKGHALAHACRLASITYSTVGSWRRLDMHFAEMLRDAYEEGTDVFVEELRRRAVEGVTKPIYYKGAVVGTVQEYSDQLLLAEIKRRRPEYRDSAAAGRQEPFDLAKLLMELDAPANDARAA